MTTEYFGPIWESGQPVRNFKLERLSTGASVELTPDEWAMLLVGLDNAITALTDTGYGRGDQLAAQYKAILDKMREV